MTKKKIGLLAIVLTLSLVVSCLFGAMMTFAEDETPGAVVTTGSETAVGSTGDAAAATAGVNASATADPNATAEPTNTSGGCLGGGWWIILIYVAILGGMFYFLIIRPSKKRKKEEAELKSSITLGQEVVTIGGIVGTIVNIKDDNITIQTSLDNSLVEVKNWAIREVKKVEVATKDDVK